MKLLAFLLLAFCCSVGTQAQTAAPNTDFAAAAPQDLTQAQVHTQAHTQAHAHAQASFPPATLNASASVGYGFGTMGAMFNIRAGAVFPIGFYAGGTCSYYLAERQVSGNSLLYTIGAEFVFLGVEAGHEFILLPQLRLRPYLTAGYAALTRIYVASPTASATVRLDDDGAGRGFVLGAGVLGVLAVSERMEAMLDIRLVSGLALSVSLGVQVRL